VQRQQTEQLSVQERLRVDAERQSELASIQQQIRDQQGERQQLVARAEQQQLELESAKERAACLEQQNLDAGIVAALTAERCKELEKQTAVMEAEVERLHQEEASAREKVESNILLIKQKEQSLLAQSSSEAAKCQALEAELSKLRQSNADLIEDNFTCGICSCRLFQPHTMPCGHTFCRDCAVDWLQRSPNCAVCRVPLHFGEQLLFNRDLSNTILAVPSTPEDDQDFQAKHLAAVATDSEDRALMTELNASREKQEAQGTIRSIVACQWQKDEIARFCDALATCPPLSKCREAYCALVKLDKEALEIASIQFLKNAAANCRLEVAGDTIALRDRIWLFIKFHYSSSK
jgi:hypothetical protein